MGKKRLLSLCISFGAVLLFFSALYLAVDFRDYPLSETNVDSKIATKEVVTFADIQGSRVYVVVGEQQR